MGLHRIAETGQTFRNLVPSALKWLFGELSRGCTYSTPEGEGEGMGHSNKFCTGMLRPAWGQNS